MSFETERKNLKTNINFARNLYTSLQLSKLNFFSSNFYFWTLDVSRTASYEITLVHLSVLYPSLRPSVTKFSQDWFISFY